MRLISWNLNSRRRDAPAQIAALLLRDPDIIALQEVTLSSLPLLRAALAGSGLSQVADSFALAAPDFRPQGPRRYAQLTASRYPLTPQPPNRFTVPWPERVLSVFLKCEGELIEVHNTHIPPGSPNGWTKIAMLKGIFTALAVRAANRRILCGDFNTPQTETTTGEVVTWAQRQTDDGKWRIVRTLRGGAGSEWDAGERGVLTGLAEYDLVDVYRALHGYGVTDSSFVLRRGALTVGRRFDHVFASRSLVPLTCRYLHHLRESGLSDHAPVEATFRVSKVGPGGS